MSWIFDIITLVSIGMIIYGSFMLAPWLGWVISGLMGMYIGVRGSIGVTAETDETDQG